MGEQFRAIWSSRWGALIPGSLRLAPGGDPPEDKNLRRNTALTDRRNRPDQEPTLEADARRSHAATMYSPVGISGCEPPQPQQFGSKINIIRGLDSDRGLAATMTRNRFCRPLSAAIPKSVDHATGVVHSSTPSLAK